MRLIHGAAVGTAVVFSVATSILLSACQQPRGARRAAGFTVHGPIEGDIQSDLAELGTPKKDPSFGHGPTQIVSRDGYVLEYSAVDKIPLWVCERLRDDHLTGPADRSKSEFEPDPLLPAGSRAELADYSGSGFDRGHQAPAGDFKHSQKAMDESFFLSNMAPQVGVGFNRHIWADLEEQVRDAARERGEVFVITGGFFYDPAEEDPSTADGIEEYKVIGPGEVAVPTHFYKIVIAKSSGSGQLQAIGFVLENRRYTNKKIGQEDVRSINWIEERTGLDFMPNLSTALEAQLEADDGTLWPNFRDN